MDTNYRVVVTTFFDEVETYDVYEIKTAHDIMSGWMLKAKSVILCETKDGKITGYRCVIGNNKFEMGV